MALMRCPITYEPLAPGQTYSQKGLHRLASRLTSLSPVSPRLPPTNALPGAQHKSLAQLSVGKGCFEPVEAGGAYILKRAPKNRPELSANEDLTLSLAACVGIETPPHGLVVGEDGEFLCFSKRYDRPGKGRVEPLASMASLLSLAPADTLAAPMEAVFEVLRKKATFPLPEQVRLFERVVFAYLVGDNNRHLGSYVLGQAEGVTKLAPACGLVNATIMNFGQLRESALSLNGKYTGLHYEDWATHLWQNTLGLPPKLLAKVLRNFKEALPTLEARIEASFLSAEKKTAYKFLVRDRARRLRLS